MAFKFNDQIPIYIQIMNLIKKDIVRGILHPGDKIPSVREMSSKLQVNPNTLQRAYQELEREGISYTQRGMGTFVREDMDIMNSLKKEMAKETIEIFINGMKELGFASNEIIDIIKEKVEEDI